MSADEKQPRSPIEPFFARRAGEVLEKFTDREQSLFSGLFGQQISLQYLVQLLQRVGNGLRAGIDARKLWEQESRHGPTSYRPVFAEIHRRISSGDTLLDAVRAAGTFFPPMLCEMVDVGERTGKMDEVLLRLAEHYGHLQSLRRMFLIGIAWPMIQLVFAIVVVGLLIWAAGFIADMRGGEPIDYLGFGLFGTQGLVIYACLVGFGFTALGLAITAVRRGWLGEAGPRWAMKIPLLGKCLQTMALARLTWTLSLALEAGADARNSLRMALRSTQTPLYTRLEKQVDEEILKGVEFHEALRSTQTFPDEFLHALEAAEISGRLAESMIVLSKDYSERAQTSMRMLTVLASFGVYGGVAMLLVYLIFRVFSTYVNMLYEFM